MTTITQQPTFPRLTAEQQRLVSKSRLGKLYVEALGGKKPELATKQVGHGK